MNKKKIYILHEYDSKSHFLALYKGNLNEDFLIEDYICLSKKFLIKRSIKSIIKDRSIKCSLSEFYSSIKKLRELRNIKDSILVVGIAPYNKLLNKYKKVFNNNKSIYFTSWQDWSGESFPRGNLKNKDNFEKILKNNFYSAACVSKKTEEEVKKYFNLTEVVNHSIPIKEYLKKDIDSVSEKTKFVYLGQLIERKNIRKIIEWIKSEDSNFEFTFIGQGELESEIIKLQRRDKRVNYKGKLSKEEIKKQLKDYDYLVLPSKDEPFGIVLIEALAAGVPCIVSNAYGPSEIIVNNYNGYLFDKNNFNEFSNVMKKAIKIDKDEYKKMVINSIESSKKYDCNEIIKKWKKLM